ncbi:MAG: nucleotidyltransferase domain-containing protein [Candidatus Nanoarchaeia archaeon]
MVGIITNMKLEIIRQYTSNYAIKLHVRELAKNIEKSHVTLLPHLEGLKEDKVLLSEKKGRNRYYTLNLANITTRNYLIMAEGLRTIRYLNQVFLIKKLAKILAELQLPGCFVLFGSYAKHTFDSKSDIDLLYIGTNTITEQKNILKQTNTLRKKINMKYLTPKQFNKALITKDNLVKEIVKSHILIQNPGIFVNTLGNYYETR